MSNKESLVLGSEVAGMFKAIIKAGADPIKDDYILVVSSDVELYNVTSPVQIVIADEIQGAVYLVQRKNYYRTEAVHE